MNRLHRILNRLLGWVVGTLASVLAIFLIGLAVYILFFDYPAQIKAWMETEASRILNREVHIERFSVNLPNSFELQGVSALPVDTGPPWLEFKSLRGELKLTGFLQREIQLSLLQVDGLTVRVQDYGGGRVDLPGLWGPPVSRPGLAAEASLTFLADRIRFEDAAFIYHNHNLPWQLEARDVRAQLDREGRSGYRGRLDYEQGEVKIKDRPAFEGVVSTQVELVGKELRVVDFRATGPFYTVRAKGGVNLGEEPRAQFSIEAESRVSPAARSLLGLPQLEGRGSTPATFVGDLSMGRGWHEIRGQIEIPAARFIGIPLRDWKGEIYWDRSILEISTARGALAGGASKLQIRQALPVAEHPAHVTVELQDVPIEDLLHAATGEPGPLASSISGTATLRIPADAPRLLSGEFELTGQVPPNAPERVGIEFSAQGEINQGNLRINRSRFVSDVALGELSGSYPRSGSADLELDLRLRDMARADRVQQTLRTLFHRQRPAQLLVIGGSGRAAGRITGRFPRLTFEGDFRGADVSFKTVRFGDVEARGRWSTDAVRFESFQARKDKGMLRGTGELGLDRQTSPNWAIDGYVRQWPAAELLEFVQISAPLDGTLSAEGDFSSRDGQLNGEAAVVLAPGSLNAVAFDRAEANVRLQGQRIILEDLSIARQDARLEGNVVFDREGGVGGQLVSRRFPISVFSRDALDLGGTMEAKLELGGSFSQPEAELEANISSVAIGGTRVGDGRLEARVEGATAQVSLSVRGEGLELEGRSRTQLLPGYPTEGELRWRHAELGPWLSSVPAGLPKSIRFLSDGEASFAGQIDSLDSFSADSVMENIRFEVGGYHLTSSSPVSVHLRRGTVRIDDLRLAGVDTQVTLTGELPLRKGNLDLVAKGSVDLQFLEGFYPSLDSSGRVELSARVRGNWERPSLSGFADISSGAVWVQEFPQALGDIHGRVAFDNRTIRFPTIRARFGGAPVTINGTLLLRGLRPDSFELGFVGQRLRLRYPEGLVATLDTDLRMSGTSQSQILSGRIDVSDATWSREYDLATGILVSRETESLALLEEIDEEAPLSNLRFDVEVVVPGTLRIRNSRATVDARAEFQLRGTFTHPALLGRMEAVRGELFLLGQRYQLVSGRVEFLDPSTIKPFFDLVAESRVRSYRVELRLTGTPERFFPELTSEPPLRTVDILRLLAGASERDILIGSEEEEIAGLGVASLLTERLTQEVGRRAERLFGLDRFSIDPFLVGQFANPTARVSVGKQIYHDLSVNYSTNLNAATETLILIEYTPEGPISWIISRDEEGAYGVDLRFRKSF